MKFLIGMMLGATVVLFMAGKASSVPGVVQLVSTRLTIEEQTDAVDSMYNVLQKMGIKFPEIVLAQAVHETDFFSSRIYRENHNLFGMRHNNRGFSIGSNLKHAKYLSTGDSIRDYAAWQKMVLRLKPCATPEEYEKLLEDLPFGKGLRYAEDPNYLQKIHLRMEQLHALKNLKDAYL